MFVLGYHVAKTGGTTVLHHIVKHLGEEAFFNYGEHPASDRFFANQPLWEDLESSEVEKVKFLFGHNVRERILLDMDPSKIALFVVLRDPYTHFVSQYKYHSKLLKLEGKSIGARDFLAETRRNSQMFQVHRGFPALTSIPGQPLSEEAAFEMISQFEYACATEKLTEHSKPLTERLGIPPIKGQYRKSDNIVDLEGLTPEELYAYSPIDHKIHQAILARHETRNAASFNAALLGQSLKKINASYTKQENVEKAYSELDMFFRHSDRIEAAQMHLAFNALHAPKYAQIIRSGPIVDRLVRRLHVARSEREKATVCIRHQHYRLARACLEKAIRLNDAYVNAYVDLAYVLIRFEERGLAIEMAEKALALEPDNVGAATFLSGLS